MSDNDIQISFTRDEVQTMAEGYAFPAEIRAKFLAALPVEHPEGTVAWIQYHDPDKRFLAVREGGKWGDGSGTPFREPVKVEPLRVLADDELAVKRLPSYCTDSDRARAYADAEATS